MHVGKLRFDPQNVQSLISVDTYSLSALCVTPDRANECAQGSSAVEDELDEIMALDHCMTMVVEYIP